MSDQPTPVNGPPMMGPRRSQQPSNRPLSSADQVFTATLQEITAKVDCDLFLNNRRKFGASIVKIALHPCYQKDGEETKVITIGCASQSSEGVTITPEYEYTDIENQCPSAMEQRLSKTTYTISIGVNETGFVRQEMMDLIWNMGDPVQQTLGGQTYRKTKFGIQRTQLPVYVVSVQPVTSDGEPVDGIITFYRAQWTPEPGDLQYSRDSSVTSKINFKALYDPNEEAIGHMLALL